MSTVLSPFINLAHRLGLSPLMARHRRTAREQGARLRFRPRAIQWERDGWVLLIDPATPYRVGYWMRVADSIVQGAVPVIKAGRRIVDLRGPALYRLPSGRAVYLPIPIETADTCSGYLLRGAPGPGDLVLDIGAYCGELAVELALLVGPEGRVFAMEPDPSSRALLQRNAELHRLANITLLPHALWNRTEELSFAALGHCASAVQTPDGPSYEPGSIIKISALSPADVFARIGRIPDFIKMDIEGAEVEAIEALAPLLAKAPHPVRLAIASYHLRDGRPTHEIITPVLMAAGFQVETGYPSHLTTWAWHPGRPS